MKEFAKKYNEASESEDKLPVASTILPVMKDGSSTSIFNCVIFYETKAINPSELEPPGGYEPEKEKKPKIKLEL